MRCVVFFCIAVLLAVHAAHAQSTLTAWTCDAGTIRLTAGATTLVVSGGQGQPGAALPSAAGVVLYPGFLGGALLATNLDHDADGLCDETDADNDNDGLRDLAELAGTAFTPATATDVNVADADGDGADDGEEARMGSNPGDPTSVLRILSLSCTGTSATLQWHARGGSDYGLRWTTNLVAGLPTNAVGSSVHATGGVAPWYDTTASLTVAMPDTNRTFFCVERLP